MADPATTVAFEAGTLRIRTPLANVAIRWRPEPYAEQLPPGRRTVWRACWPELRLLRPADVAPAPVPQPGGAAHDEEGRAAAFAAFRRDLPPELAAAAERFRSHQWPLLVLLHRQPGALDLARSNPALAYSLAINDEFRGTTREAAAIQAVWYSYRRQRVILKWLGFPETEAMARLMRKIAPEAAAPSLLRALRGAIAADAGVMARLAHLPVINAGVLGLVSIPRLLPLVTPALLAEVAAAPDELVMPQTTDRLLAATAILADLAPRRHIGPLKSMARVARLADAVDEEYQAHQEELRALRAAREQARREEQERAAAQGRERREREREARLRREAQNRLPYPPPPIPGTQDIVPLTCRRQLETEGFLQRNCVATFHAEVIRGRTYVYRVLAPERATLAIACGPDHCWYRAQLKARANASVKPSTAAAVDAWLRAYSTSV